MIVDRFIAVKENPHRSGIYAPPNFQTPAHSLTKIARLAGGNIFLSSIVISKRKLSRTIYQWAYS